MSLNLCLTAGYTNLSEGHFYFRQRILFVAAENSSNSWRSS
jgi:hypothetical protein